MARVTYNHEYPVPFEHDDNGEVSKQLMVRMQIENGKRVRFAYGYQIRDNASGRLKDIVRYDDAHGGFHCHSPGFPPDPGNKTWLTNVSPGQEHNYVVQDLEQNSEIYESIARRTGYEVSDDEENSDEANS